MRWPKGRWLILMLVNVMNFHEELQITRLPAAFDDLPKDIQSLAKEKYIFWKSNPRHPSLHFKPVGKYCSVRINRNYRALCLRSRDRYIWFWIGTHAEYNRVI